MVRFSLVFAGLHSSIVLSNQGGPQGHVYHWNSHEFLDSVSVLLTAFEDDIATDYVENASTDAFGEYAFSSENGDSSRLSLSRDINAVDAGSVISSADALAALKIAVGINPNLDPDGSGPLTAPAVSPFQLIAADVNQDERITSADALAILKMAVRLESALSRAWVFIPEDTSFWDPAENYGAGGFTTNRADVPPFSEPKLVEYSSTQGDINFVGVLMGDVNGNWTSSSEALETSYFSDLARQISGLFAQWGISDRDSDGVEDTEDLFPSDPAEALDTDSDGIGNNEDLDDDNDGVLDGLDAFPLDPSETQDSDFDAIGNNADNDDDNDGLSDDLDPLPLDPTPSTIDTDGDGILDHLDVYPLDSRKTKSVAFDFSSAESIGIGSALTQSQSVSETPTASNLVRFLKTISRLLIPEALADLVGLSQQTNGIAWDKDGQIVVDSIMSNESLYLTEAAVSPDGKFIYLLTSNHIQRAIPNLSPEVCSIYRVTLATNQFKCLLNSDVGDIEPKSLISSHITDFSRRGIDFRSDGSAVLQGFDWERTLPEGAGGGTNSTVAWHLTPEGVLARLPIAADFLVRGVLWINDRYIGVAENPMYRDDGVDRDGQEFLSIIDASTLEVVKRILVPNIGYGPLARHNNNIYWAYSNGDYLDGDSLTIQSSQGGGTPIVDESQQYRFLFSDTNDINNSLTSSDGTVTLALSDGVGRAYNWQKQSGTGTDIKYVAFNLTEDYASYLKTYGPRKPIISIEGEPFTPNKIFTLANGRGSLEVQGYRDIFRIRPSASVQGDLDISYVVSVDGIESSKVLTISSATILNWRADADRENDFIEWASPEPDEEGFCVFEYETSTNQCVRFGDYRVLSTDMEYLRSKRYDGQAVYPDGSGNAFPGIQTIQFVGDDLRVYFKDSKNHKYYEAKSKVSDFITLGYSALEISLSENGAGDANIMTLATDLEPLPPRSLSNITASMAYSAGDAIIKLRLPHLDGSAFSTLSDSPKLGLSQIAPPPEFVVNNGTNKLQVLDVSWSDDRNEASVRISSSNAVEELEIQFDSYFFLADDIRRYYSGESIIAKSDNIPRFLSQDTFYAFENRTAIGRLTVFDADSDALTFSTAGDDADKITLDGEGILSFVEAPDFESKVSYSLTASVSDGTNLVSQDLVVIVRDVDEDRDYDGIPDSRDAFPTDPAETADTDGDGIGNNADRDDDDDGYEDSIELLSGTDPLNAGQKPKSADYVVRIKVDQKVELKIADIDDVIDVSMTDPEDNVVESYTANFGDTVSYAVSDTTLVSGTKLEIQLRNTSLGYSFDWKLMVDGVIVEEAGCGRFNISGCSNDSGDVGVVYSASIKFEVDSDTDGDGVDDAVDAFPEIVGEWLDTDGDGQGDNADPDDDGDLIEDSVDAFPKDPEESLDTDGDGLGNNADLDDDNDGITDDLESDIGTNPLRIDTDNDGASDLDDAFPLDASEIVDSDRNGVGDNADPDNDSDGIPDGAFLRVIKEGRVDEKWDFGIYGLQVTGDASQSHVIICPSVLSRNHAAYEAKVASYSYDEVSADTPRTVYDPSGAACDGVAISVVSDEPYLPGETIGVDFASSVSLTGFTVETEVPMGLDSLSSGEIVFDIRLLGESDVDFLVALNDNADEDLSQYFLGNRRGKQVSVRHQGGSWQRVRVAIAEMSDYQTNRSDFDFTKIDHVVLRSVGLFPDTSFRIRNLFLFAQTDPVLDEYVPPDSDGDGVEDSLDAFPNDPLESIDSDGDSIGNVADRDDDNDGITDEGDMFSLDPSEFLDSDSDGIGNNADQDDDGDGVPDQQDAFPLDKTETKDTDGDGWGDNGDIWDLFISEYSSPWPDKKSRAWIKYLEIYNPTGNEVSLDQYFLGKVNNNPKQKGQYEAAIEFTKGAVLAPGDVWVIGRINSENIDEFGDSSAGVMRIANHVDQVSTAINHNGDDAYKLFKKLGDDPNAYQILDSFGDFEGDPGDSWIVCGEKIREAEATILTRKPWAAGVTAAFFQKLPLGSINPNGDQSFRYMDPDWLDLNEFWREWVSANLCLWDAEIGIPDVLEYPFDGVGRHSFERWDQRVASELGKDEDTDKDGIINRIDRDDDNDGYDDEIEIAESTDPLDERSKPVRAHYTVRVSRHSDIALHLKDIDDSIKVSVDSYMGTSLATYAANFGDTVTLDITDDIAGPSSTLRLQLINDTAGYSFDWSLEVDGESVLHARCGDFNTFGCANNSYEQGAVYAVEIILENDFDEFSDVGADPEDPVSNQAEFSSASGNSVVSADGNTFTVTAGGENYGVFANMNTDLYPLRFTDAGNITFTADVADGGEVDIFFYLENNSHPDAAPSYTGVVTVSGSTPAAYTVAIPSQGAITFNFLGIIFYGRDVAVTLTDIFVNGEISVQDDDDGST